MAKASNRPVKEISEYNRLQKDEESKEICMTLSAFLHEEFSDAVSMIWHAHPVWFLQGNPIVGYSKQKAGVRLMFWSGADFDEEDLKPGTGKFKDASRIYTSAGQLNFTDLKRWIKKARKIQWDYKNVVKRKGKLVRLTTEL